MVAVQFFYGPCLSFFLVIERSLFILGYILGIFLTESRTLEIFKSLRNRRNLGIDKIAFDVFDLKLAGRYGFISLPVRSFFFKSVLLKKSVLAARSLLV